MKEADKKICSKCKTLLPITAFYKGSGEYKSNLYSRHCKSCSKDRLYANKDKYNKKMAAKLTIKTIQLVYEDNIKKFGTLTCNFCLKPIEMQKEHLEHKNPLSKGGSNDYENLGIACSRCNKRKKDKTVAQYLEYLNKKGEN